MSEPGDPRYGLFEQPGQRGAGVKALQERLNEHRRAAGQAPIATDGQFGPATERALESFQRDRGIEPSGRADAATDAALASTPLRPSLERGAEGTAVKALQERINGHRRAAGQAPLAEDGQLGPATATAIREFQEAKGLPATGTLSDETSEALDLAAVPVEPL